MCEDVIHMINELIKQLSSRLDTFLDNILLTQESLKWVEESKHNYSIFLNLDFSKAYDRVAWDFMCHPRWELFLMPHRSLLLN